jgi:hypothetical protein
VAISALYQLVGAPSPESHHLVQAVQEAARRTKRFRRGSVAPLYCRELPPFLGSPPSSLPGPRLGLSSRARYCQRAATVRHMALMHDAAIRFDDTREGQLGDILHSPEKTKIRLVRIHLLRLSLMSSGQRRTNSCAPAAR